MQTCPTLVVNRSSQRSAGVRLFPDTRGKIFQDPATLQCLELQVTVALPIRALLLIALTMRRSIDTIIMATMHQRAESSMSIITMQIHKVRCYSLGSLT